MKSLRKIAVTYLLPFLILKRDMLSFLCPIHAPACILHFSDKLLPAGAILHHIQHSHGTICHITILCMVTEQIVFVFAPCNHFSVLNLTAIKMFAFFRYSKSTFPAHPIRQLLHTFQIFSGIMEFFPIFVAYRISNYMAVNMVFILVNTDNCLKTGKPFFSKFYSKFQSLLRCDLLIFMPGNHIMGIHPTGILPP